MRQLAGLRVLLVAEYGGTGGTRTYLKQLVEFYRRQLVELIVIRDGPSADPDMDSFLAGYGVESFGYFSIAPGSQASLPQRLVRIPSRHDLQAESEAFRKWCQHQNIDVIVSSVGTPGKFLGALAQGPVGLYILHTYPHGLRSTVFSQLMMPAHIPPSTLLITVSNFAARMIVRKWKLQARRDDVHVLYSTMGWPTQRPLQSGTDLSVLSLGHVERYKGVYEWIDVAVDVLSRPGMESANFTWAGEGSLLESCRRRIKRTGFERQIRFIGKTSDIDSLYDECQVYLQTSRVESLGLGVIDAARRGIPAVVANTGGLSEVVSTGETGYVYRLDQPAEAVEALLVMLKDRSQREAMGGEAQSRYGRLFSPETWDLNLVKLHLLALGTEPTDGEGLLRE